MRTVTTTSGESPDDLPPHLQEAFRKAGEEIRKSLSKGWMDAVMRPQMAAINRSIFENLAVAPFVKIDLSVPVDIINRTLLADGALERITRAFTEPLTAGVLEAATPQLRTEWLLRIMQSVEDDSDANNVVEDAVDELVKQDPSISREVLRPWVVLYAFTIYAALLMTLYMTYPELMKMWLSSVGLNATKLSEMTGKVYDRVYDKVMGPEQDEE